MSLPAAFSVRSLLGCFLLRIMQATVTCSLCAETTLQTCEEILLHDDLAAQSLCWRMQGWSKSKTSKQWRCTKCVGGTDPKNEAFVLSHKVNYPACCQRHSTTKQQPFPAVSLPPPALGAPALGALQLAASSAAEAFPSQQPATGDPAHGAPQLAASSATAAVPFHLGVVPLQPPAIGECTDGEGPKQAPHVGEGQDGEQAAIEEKLLRMNLNELRQVIEDEGLRVSKRFAVSFSDTQKKQREMKELQHQVLEGQAWLLDQMKQQQQQQYQRSSCIRCRRLCH